MSEIPMKHYELVSLDESFDIQDTVFSIYKEVGIRVANLIDDSITKAIIDETRKDGFTDVYILDKRFIFDAIREKLERDDLKGENQDDKT